MTKDPRPGILSVTNYGFQGEGPWRYRLLGEDDLTKTLEKMSRVRTYAGGRVDSVTLQPCTEPSQASQDRRIAGTWDLPDGTWTYAGVFDGHGGEETAQLAAEFLPAALKDAFRAIVRKGREPEKNTIGSTLQQTISDFDEYIKKQFLDIFPGGLKQINKMSDAEVRELINDQDQGGVNYAKAIRCMRGTTAVIAVLSPSKKHLWVANLGDSLAVMASESDMGDVTARVVTRSHSCLNKGEVKRILLDHPNESDAVLGGRVVGAIMVTRAIGDIEFKIDQQYTRKVFRNTIPGFKTHTKVEDWNSRILTPPYLSNVADIHHFNLTEDDKFLILATDGLLDLCHPDPPAKAAQTWVDAIYAEETWSQGKAKSLRVLRRALGGVNVRNVSMQLTVEMDTRWMDDTTITVMDLQSELQP